MQLAVELRELLPGDAGFRPTFVGHILIEMLLDAFWIRDDCAIAERYYTALEIDPRRDDRALRQSQSRENRPTS